MVSPFMQQSYIEISGARENNLRLSRMTTSSLPGGECQRLKLASELHKCGQIHVLDEPTTGLHMVDLKRLLSIMNRLVEEGNSVIVIEHKFDIVKNAD